MSDYIFPHISCAPTLRILHLIGQISLPLMWGDLSKQFSLEHVSLGIDLFYSFGFDYR